MLSLSWSSFLIEKTSVVRLFVLVNFAINLTCQPRAAVFVSPLSKACWISFSQCQRSLMPEAVVYVCFSLPTRVDVKKHEQIHTSLSTKGSDIRVAQPQQSEGRHLSPISQLEECNGTCDFLSPSCSLLQTTHANTNKCTHAHAHTNTSTCKQHQTRTIDTRTQIPKAHTTETQKAHTTETQRDKYTQKNGTWKRGWKAEIWRRIKHWKNQTNRKKDCTGEGMRDGVFRAIKPDHPASSQQHSKQAKHMKHNVRPSRSIVFHAARFMDGPTAIRSHWTAAEKNRTFPAKAKYVLALLCVFLRPLHTDAGTNTALWLPGTPQRLKNLIPDIPFCRFLSLFPAIPRFVEETTVNTMQRLYNEHC